MSGKIITGKLSKGHSDDAGQDVYSNESITIQPRSSAVIPTNLRIIVPHGNVGLLKSRSGLSVKHKLEVGAGVIDSGYRGEVKVHLYNHSNKEYKVIKGDRIAQLLTIKIDLSEYKQESSKDFDNEYSIPKVAIKSATHSTTLKQRGESGFGSTGN